MKSIMQDEKVCYLTKKQGDGSLYGSLDRHEIFFGNDKQTSIKNGFYIYLRHDHHIQDSPFKTPHNSRELDLKLKMECQAKYEETHSRSEFMKLIGKNYLD